MLRKKSVIDVGPPATNFNGLRKKISANPTANRNTAKVSVRTRKRVYDHRKEKQERKKEDWEQGKKTNSAHVGRTHAFFFEARGTYGTLISTFKVEILRVIRTFGHASLIATQKIKKLRIFFYFFIFLPCTS